jgi:hypothetical protein
MRDMKEERVDDPCYKTKQRNRYEGHSVKTSTKQADRDGELKIEYDQDGQKDSRTALTITRTI